MVNPIVNKLFKPCLVISSFGFIIGYNIGVSGGLTTMESFLSKFFPAVLRQLKDEVSTNGYCKFDNTLLTVFTSSLYLATLLSSFYASALTRAFCHKWTMFGSGVIFLTGSVLNGCADRILELIIGRLMLGVGVGLSIQAVPLYLSEIAPAQMVGLLNLGFQITITIGNFAANLINYLASKIEGGWGWRVSLAMVVIPAGIVTIGSLHLPDKSESSLMQSLLEKNRVRDDSEAQNDVLVASIDDSVATMHHWSSILQRKYIPQITMAILIPFFQQLTGINFFMFYSPVLFKSIGFGEGASLMFTVIINAVSIIAMLVSVFIINIDDRRCLFLEGGALMLRCQIILGTLLGIKFGAPISMEYTGIVISFICIYVAAFTWSWGLLGWLLPSEIFPVEIWLAGKRIATTVNMLFTFIVAQLFLPLLCHMKFALFYFFAGWLFVMTVFIALFLPETRNVPIEKMPRVWKAHWFWRKFMPEHVGGD